MVVRVMKSKVPPIPHVNPFLSCALWCCWGCARRGDAGAFGRVGTARGPTANGSLSVVSSTEREQGRAIDGDPALSGSNHEFAGMGHECESVRCGHPCRYGIVVRVGFMFDECKALRKWH